MAKQNLISFAIRTETKQGTGEKREILMTKWKDKESKCKECGTGQRLHGSSRCDSCKKQKKIQNFNNEALKKRISKA